MLESELEVAKVSVTAVAEKAACPLRILRSFQDVVIAMSSSPVPRPNPASPAFAARCSSLSVGLRQSACVCRVCRQCGVCCWMLSPGTGASGRFQIQDDHV